MYEASSGKLLDTGVTLAANSVQQDRTGSRVLLDRTRVYDIDLHLTGTIAANNVVASVLSPDGTHVYTYDSNHQLKRYDLPNTATAAATWTPATQVETATDVLMAIAPDGQSVFVVGHNSLLVFPVQ